MNDEITDLRDQLTKLARTRDPVKRDLLAKQLGERAPAALQRVRVQAAKDAVAGGMRAAEYAAAIGQSPQRVNNLLHRYDKKSGKPIPPS